MDKACNSWSHLVCAAQQSISMHNVTWITGNRNCSSHGWAVLRLPLRALLNPGFLPGRWFQRAQLAVARA